MVVADLEQRLYPIVFYINANILENAIASPRFEMSRS